MSLYKRKMNPFTGTFDYVIKGNIVSFEEGVATVGDLPVTGNVEGDARIANDNHHLYVWNGSAWVDEGDIIDIKWATLEDKPSSLVADIDDAVSKKHSQNTDTDLDATFEATFVKKVDTVNVLSDITSTGANIEDAVTKKHEHSNKAELDLLTDGNHDIRSDNPHTVTVDQLDLASGTVANDVDDAVDKKHAHSNKSLLDTYDQTNVDIADAISKEHIHGNKPTLDNIEEALTSILKADYDDAVSKEHTHSNKIVLDGTDTPFTIILKGGYDDAVIHTDLIDNPHIVTVDQLDLASGTVAADVDDAIDKKHTQNSDTMLDNGQPNQVDAGDLRGHLDSVANPHVVTVDQLDLATGTVASDIDEAIENKHAQNTDIALRTDKLTVDASGHTTTAGELKIKVYEQDAEPTLNADDFLAIWKDTSVSGLPQVYFVYRRGVGDQVSVELA